MASPDRTGPARGAAPAGSTGRALRERLTRRTVELCGRLSVTGDEAALADALAAEHAGDRVARVGDSLVIGAQDSRPLVLLVGHLDVVPPSDAERTPHVVVHGGTEVVVGRGASDMKGGVAVAEALHAGMGDTSPFATVLVLYAGEEGPDEGNQLRQVLAEVPWLREAALAVVLEPTDLEVQAGCLGGLHAELTFRGRAAHSARPWLGDNALHRAGSFLTELDSRAPRDVDVSGVTYRDVWVATRAWTPQEARNVVPDAFVVNLNLRFAPDRTLDQAEQELRDLVGDRATVRIVDRAPPALPRLDDPLVARLVEAVAAPVTAKQAWTDVARLAQAGVPAVNYGPGLTAQAHRSGEYVPVDNLVSAYSGLARFLSG